MNSKEENKILEKTILNPGIAKPIKIKSNDAKNIALNQQNINEKTPKQKNRDEEILKPTKITKEELEIEKINELNDFKKNEYVKIVDIHHSKKTYIILILVLIIIVLIIVFEVLYFRGKA